MTLELRAELQALARFVNATGAARVSFVTDKVDVLFSNGVVKAIMRVDRSEYSFPLDLVVPAEPIAQPAVKEPSPRSFKYALVGPDETVGRGRWDSIEEIFTEIGGLREGVRPIVIFDDNTTRELLVDEVMQVTELMGGR